MCKIYQLHILNVLLSKILQFNSLKIFTSKMPVFSKKCLLGVCGKLCSHLKVYYIW